MIKVMAIYFLYGLAMGFVTVHLAHKAKYARYGGLISFVLGGVAGALWVWGALFFGVPVWATVLPYVIAVWIPICWRKKMAI